LRVGISGHAFFAKLSIPQSGTPTGARTLALFEAGRVPSKNNMEIRGGNFRGLIGDTPKMAAPNRGGMK
jgi:hypothetical protein